MNRKLRPTRTAQQLKDEQINFMLEDIKKDIENFKLVISEKDKQLRDLKNILFAAKASYKKVTEGNKHLKQRIVSIKENKKQRQQQPTPEEYQNQYQNLYYPKQPTRQKNIKKIVYTEENDTDSKPEREKEVYMLPEIVVEEEKGGTTEQNNDLKQHQQPKQQKLPQKIKIKIFNYLNSKDAKKNRN